MGDTPLRGHIFISYRSIESEFALKLAADLQRAGIKLWMDKLDGIVVGDIWSREIDSALKNSVGLIPILTTDYFSTSFVCSDELGYAYGNQLPIYPVLLKDVDKKHLPFWLQSRQFIDFRQYADDSLYQKQLTELIKRIKQKQSLITDRSEEERYLDSLIRDLSKSGRGVLEYVELSMQGSTLSVYDNWFDDTGWDPTFALLVQHKTTEESETIRKTEPLTNIWEAVNKHPRFVLMGEPGAGKTTTIRKLAWDTAQRRLEAPKNSTNSPLPLLLYLPQWGNELTPLEFVRKHWQFTTDPEDLLIRGEVLLYLDGLNEMGAAGAEKAKKLRDWLHGDDAPKHVIVTCRAGDYAGDLDLDLPTVLAEEMKEQQIRQFAVNYLGAGNASNFLTQLGYFPDVYYEWPDTQDWEWGHERSLFRLARNPYLLAALVFIYTRFC